MFIWCAVLARAERRRKIERARSREWKKKNSHVNFFFLWWCLSICVNIFAVLRWHTLFHFSQFHMRSDRIFDIFICFIVLHPLKKKKVQQTLANIRHQSPSEYIERLKKSSRKHWFGTNKWLHMLLNLLKTAKISKMRHDGNGVHKRKNDKTKWNRLTTRKQIHAVHVLLYVQDLWYWCSCVKCK